MKISKKQLQHIVNNISGEIELDQLFDRILLLAKIEQGRRDIANGDYLTSEELDEEIKKW